MESNKPVPGRVTGEVHGHILKITIDNVAKKNSFTPQMLEQMSEALTVLDRNDDLRVGVVCAEGKDFTAGMDLPRFFGPKAENWDLKDGNIDVLALKNRCRKPIITAVQGIVFTLGIEIMLAGDIVVAASDSRFSQLEAKRGLAPLGGAHFRFLSRAGWGDSMYHLLLCDEFSADRAFKIGLVQEVVEPGQQIERAMVLANRIAANAPIAIQVTKESALKFIESGEKEAIAFMPAIRDRVLNTEDFKEGLRSFAERRAGVFIGK
jgi:enoyl-CoA hydratase